MSTSRGSVSYADANMYKKELNKMAYSTSHNWDLPDKKATACD